MATNVAPPVEKTVESPVQVERIGEDTVELDLPENSMNCNRVIPQDIIEIGDSARSWFMWDMQKKTPRNPLTQNGWAGKCAWGRDKVSWDSRAGSRFSDVIDALGTTDGSYDDSWYWPDGTGPDGVEEDPHDLYPMCIVPHKDFQSDPPLLFVDFDDVIVDGEMTREAWDIIQSLGGYGEVSTSGTGAHALVRGRLPVELDAKKVLEDLDDGGHIELYGYPADGQIIGTTWMHIDETPRNSVPHAQDVIDSIIDEYVGDDEKLTDEEQAQRALKRRTSGPTGSSESDRSAYYDIDPRPIANTGPFAAHGSNGQGPHPVHGAESGAQWDDESTNFTVSLADGWHCFVHDSGGGALQLIAVIEGIRDCRDASDVMSDPVDALRVCLAARDEYTDGALDDENPPTVALKGVAEVMGMDYPEDGQLPGQLYWTVRDLWDEMQYDRGTR